ncbi:MAG: recombinase family protein, partial [Candidatus Coproplasma sp.]
QTVQDYGVNLISVEEGIDSSQASGKLLISVLSAVAEIERENILEQTMNGRREKARQGLWNGGPAPYGYSLKDDTLEINEEEAGVVRIIFDKFANSGLGYNGVAKYLNLQGIGKNRHKESDITVWSARSVQCVLDNPVYAGKIAYGRRTKEKVKGSRDDYRTIRSKDYLLFDGKHQALIDNETWEKTRAKRNSTGVKSPSRVGRERIHLLTGLLRCPKCGSPMYCNRHYWQKKDGTDKDVYYYYCGHNGNPRGYVCDYKAKLKKTDIEPYVIEAIMELVRGESFAKEIESRIGQPVNTQAIDKELTNFKKKLLEVESNKANLEEAIDNLPLDAKYRERKLRDMSARLDGLYDSMAELEENIADAELRKTAMEEDAITLDNIYKLLLSFDEIYDIMSEKEKKDLISYLIKEVQIYPNDEPAVMPLKSITLNFPIYIDNQEVNKLLWDKQGSVETLVVLSRSTI